MEIVAILHAGQLPDAVLSLSHRRWETNHFFCKNRSFHQKLSLSSHKGLGFFPAKDLKNPNWRKNMKNLLPSNEIGHMIPLV